MDKEEKPFTDEDIRNEFKTIGKVLVILTQAIGECQKFIDQHAETINQNKDRSIKSFKEIDITIRGVQTDMDKIFEMIHDLKNLPNILTVLQDFDNLRKNEKDKTD